LRAEISELNDSSQNMPSQSEEFGQHNAWRTACRFSIISPHPLALAFGGPELGNDLAESKSILPEKSFSTMN